MSIIGLSFNRAPASVRPPLVLNIEQDWDQGLTVICSFERLVFFRLQFVPRPSQGSNMNLKGNKVRLSPTIAGSVHHLPSQGMSITRHRRAGLSINRPRRVFLSPVVAGSVYQPTKYVLGGVILFH